MIAPFGYAGPIVASLAFNGIWAAVGAICIYLYLNRGKLSKNKLLYSLTKPFHRIIKKVAVRRLDKQNKVKNK